MTDNQVPPGESLLKFPCDFTIKVFGLANDDFEAAALGIIHKHAPNFTDQAFQARPSEGGKYKALSITIHAESKEQLDAIYMELSASPHILMVL